MHKSTSLLRSRDSHARVTFVEEETVLLPMMLARACQSRLCPDGETCIDGDCGSELVARDIAHAKLKERIDAKSKQFSLLLDKIIE